MSNCIRLNKVGEKDIKLAQRLQAEIFPNEKSPEQVERGIIYNNPINFIAYYKNEPVGIVGIYFQENLPEHVLLNWFGVLKEKRGHGYGKEILKEIINYIKSNLKNKSYLTYYSNKKENKTAIKLYNSLNFKTEDYQNKEDIIELNKLGVENDFVIGIYKLNGKEVPNVKDINLRISEQFEELSNYN